MFIPDPKSGRLPIAYNTRYILRSRRELNPLFRLPTRHRDRVVHQPLCAETVYFVTLDGLEPPLSGPKPDVLPLDDRVIFVVPQGFEPRLFRLKTERVANYTIGHYINEKTQLVN